jgi:hypothetical protein
VFKKLNLAGPIALVILGILPVPAFCQQNDPSQNAVSEDQNSKRIFWIIPNFRTSPTLAEYKPLKPSGKFKIARQDTFDRGTFALAAAFAGEAQLNNSNKSFGQGVEGYAHYLGTAYGDFLIGNYLTEGIYPTLFHQDPRYFRRGQGKFMSRLVYSAGQIFLTHGDSGRTQFNFSEVAGNSTAVAISMAYYPENRDVGDAVSKLGTQLGVDMVANILKEFAPDLTRKFSKKHN